MRKFGVASGLALVIAWGSWLLAAPVFGPLSLTPHTAVVGQRKVLTVTATIQDPLLLPASVNLQQIDPAGKVLAIVGTLRDDGVNGDAVAGDKTFTLRWSVQPTVIGQLRYQVSAAFKGLLRRVASTPVALNVTAPPLSVQPTVAPTEPASATVGLLGGALSVTGADGMRYTLAIPAGALSADQGISLLPLLDLGGLPPSGRFLAGVRLLPDGLTFAIPATLTIEVPNPLVLSDVLLGYSYRDTGEQFHAKPATVNGNTIALYIRHFSGNGAFTATAGTCAALQASPPSDPEDLHELILACDKFFDDERDRYADELLYDWMNTVRPGLSNACTKESLKEAAGVYGMFENSSAVLGSDMDSELEAAVGEGRQLLEAAVSCVQGKAEPACAAAATCSTVRPLLDDLFWLEKLADTFGLSGVETTTAPCGGLLSDEALGVEIQPVTERIVVGESRLFTATITSRLEDPATLVWLSTSPEIASVSNGTVTGHSPGSAAIAIEATQCGSTMLSAEAHASVTVYRRAETLEVSPSSATLGTQQSLQIFAIAKDSLGQSLPVSWSIAPDGIASLNSGGQDRAEVVAGNQEGDVIVTAEAGGKTAYARIQVRILKRFELVPSSFDLAVGASRQLTVVATDGAGQTVNNPVVSWDIPCCNVVAFDPLTRTVTGISPLTTVLTGTWSGVSATVTVTVVRTRTLGIVPSSFELAVGASRHLTVVATDENGQKVVDPVVSWEIPCCDVIGFDPLTRTVVGINPLTAILTATWAGVSASVTVVVVRPPTFEGPAGGAYWRRVVWPDNTGDYSNPNAICLASGVFQGSLRVVNYGEIQITMGAGSAPYLPEYLREPRYGCTGGISWAANTRTHTLTRQGNTLTFERRQVLSLEWERLDSVVAIIDNSPSDPRISGSWTARMTQRKGQLVVGEEVSEITLFSIPLVK